MTIGLDIGYGHVKWTTDGENVLSFPSVVSSSDFSEEEELFVHTNGMSDLALSLNGRRLLVGERALREDAQATRILAASRVTGDEFKALFATVMLMGEGEKHIVTGLPYTATKEQRDQLKRTLEQGIGTAIGLAGAIKGHVWAGNLSSVQVFKQAQAMLFDAIFEHRRGVLVPVRDEILLEVPGTRAAIVDVGYKTTDVIVCEILPEFRVIQELSFTIPLAVSAVGTRIQRAFQRMSGEDTLDARRLEFVLAGQKISNFGQVLDLSDEKNRAVKEIGMQMRNQILEKWGKALMSISVVYVGGGGAELFAQGFVNQLHQNVTKIKNPQGANARGYFKMDALLSR
ncbi:ParM/StbA family protein [Sulfoacidibacillus thermotolerans]|uniref:Uncharacterized protein n=1 Tax=Sulfoacidibacillus thermotolerans TaxID=1765684 RepID=A0A2U3D5T8_SULT2|nr:ParM/StbA family protein [Sulfoacidibacillus thermotolerans]PWI56635.1 hypothetical protein BM613_12705 [Sulfoacidibacillus thermotolerans]